jgi:hypothetical protein
MPLNDDAGYALSVDLDVPITPLRMRLRIAN